MPNNRNAGGVSSATRTASIPPPDGAASPVRNWQHVAILFLVLQRLPRFPGRRSLILGPTVPLTLHSHLRPQPRNRRRGCRRIAFLVPGSGRAASRALGLLLTALRNMAGFRSPLVFPKNVTKSLKTHSSISTTDTSTNPTPASCLVGV